MPLSYISLTPALRTFPVAGRVFDYLLDCYRVRLILPFQPTAGHAVKQAGSRDESHQRTELVLGDCQHRVTFSTTTTTTTATIHLLSFYLTSHCNKQVPSQRLSCLSHKSRRLNIWFCRDECNFVVRHSRGLSERCIFGILFASA